MSRRARALEAHEARLEADLTRAQLDALRVELAPHFLFNALHSIAALIRTRANERALSMLLGLSDLLRTAVDGTGTKTTSLAAEVALVVRYVDLQQLRFGERLDVRYAIAPDAESCAVPTLLLQPLVENAFRHGIARQPGRCQLEIGAALDSDVLRLWVRDDGAGLAPGFRLDDTAGTGLRNVRLRLQRLYDGAATVDLSRAVNGGTMASVSLPARRETRHTDRQAAG
jgi:LytS/YehU family sensor histidine kinase